MDKLYTYIHQISATFTIGRIRIWSRNSLTGPTWKNMHWWAVQQPPLPCLYIILLYPIIYMRNDACKTVKSHLAQVPAKIKHVHNV